MRGCSGTLRKCTGPTVSRKASASLPLATLMQRPFAMLMQLPIDTSGPSAISTSVQSALASLSSPTQVKRLHLIELALDAYQRDGKPQEALQKMFPTLQKADALVVMLSVQYAQTHSLAQQGSRRRFLKNGGRYSLICILHCFLLIDPGTFFELFFCLRQCGSRLMKSTR
jgi:hypothetical protein